jgi:lysophospholipase L1-like esterase
MFIGLGPLISGIKSITSFLQIFTTNVGPFVHTGPSKTFTDYEGLTKTVPQDQSAHVGARMVENLLTGATYVGIGATYTDNGDGTSTVSGMTGSATRAEEEVLSGVSIDGREFVQSLEVRGSGADIGKNVLINIKRGAGGTFTGAAKQITLTGDWQHVAGSTLTGVTSNTGVIAQIGGATGNSAASVDFRKDQLEEVTDQFNQNPSQHVDGVRFLDIENGNTVDGLGNVTEGSGPSISVTDEFSRHETNLFRLSTWDDVFTAPFEADGATVTLSADKRTATFVNPGGGRVFIGTTSNFVSGRTYCLSCRVDIQSGAAGTLENMQAFVTAPTGENSLDFPSSGLLQVVFTANATESKIVRYGIGVNGNEAAASTMVMTEPLLRDVTGLVNQNAPSELVDRTSAFLATNTNTVSSNVVTELSGVSISPIRAYDSGVIFGDSFTNDFTDLGSNLPTLSGIAFSTQGVSGDTLPQILSVLTGHTFKSSDNFVLIEGGINDIVQASVDPTTQMAIDQAAAVAFAIANELQYQVYTVGPWKAHTSWTSEKQGWTDTYNQSIRDTYDPRRVTDMFTILEDPGAADTLLAAFDSGDGLHPNATGFAAVDAVTDPLLTPEFMRGVLLDTSPTEMRRAWSVPVNGVSFQLKVTLNFNGSDAKGADHALFSLVFDATNYLELAVDATNDQIHLNRSVGGVVGAASTTAAALNYVAGDELNMRVVADKDGLRLWVDAVTATSTTAAAKADFTSPPTEIRVNENASGVTGLSITVASDEVWNEAMSDTFMQNLT